MEEAHNTLTAKRLFLVPALIPRKPKSNHHHGRSSDSLPYPLVAAFPSLVLNCDSGLVATRARPSWDAESSQQRVLFRIFT